MSPSSAALNSRLRFFSVSQIHLLATLDRSMRYNFTSKSLASTSAAAVLSAWLSPVKIAIMPWRESDPCVPADPPRSLWFSRACDARVRRSRSVSSASITLSHVATGLTRLAIDS